jgi:L,D-peptidoglycan transpeptidase YkuD (ErfK/YbiS/YcfS/YnhG family)
MKIERLRSAWLVALLAVSLSCQSAEVLPAASRQLVLVVTADWDANQGTLRTFERGQRGWQPRGDGFAVSIGRAGSAWGIGMHDPQAGVQKREGDGRSPAGVFAIGTAFGYASEARAGIPYQAMSEYDYCIDVNESPLYNRIVDARNVERQWIDKSSEPMRRDLHVNGDQRYKLGFVIDHNPKHLTTKGSCIFAHLWGTPGQTTAGCTAMNERAMRDLLEWLDADAQPVFVLLPYPEYQRLERAWHLPGNVPAPQ